MGNSSVSKEEQKTLDSLTSEQKTCEYLSFFIIFGFNFFFPNSLQ